MKKSFKLLLAAAFLVAEVFAVTLPILTTSAKADGAIQAITHAGFGGGTDVTTRMMLLRARRVLKQDMQLVNKKGGGGAVSMDYMMSLPADGQHTLTWTTGHAVSMALGKTKVKLSDMQPLARGTDDPQLFVVNCKADIKDAKTFISTSKSKSLKYGTTHTGGIDDVSAIAFTKKGGLKDPTIVAYKGVAPIKTNLIKGDIDVGVLNLGEALTEINEGTLCVSIVLANNRMAKIGDSPTATELGIPVVLSTVRGFVTKKGAPAERVKELEAGMLKAMSHNYYKNFLTEIGLDETSVVGADEWGAQMEVMLAEMTAQLKALGYTN
jgi:tripartite-type tricarboxylate transporter receptor subunit TctC